MTQFSTLLKLSKMFKKRLKTWTRHFAKGSLRLKDHSFSATKILTWPKMRHLFTKASLDLKKEPIGLKGVTWRIRHFANAYAEKIWILLWPNYAFLDK